MVRRLKDLGYIRDDILAGHVLLTDAGEQVLREFRESGGRGHPRPAESGEAEGGGGGGAQSRQETLDRGEASERADEHLPLLMRAESLFRQGKYALCILAAYEYMVNALKSAYGIEKGHLPDLVAQLRGVDVGITLEEAKTAKTLVIEARKAIDEGRRASMTDAGKMVELARRVSRALGGGGGG